MARILVIDDDDQVREMLRQMIHNAGHDVAVAAVNACRAAEGQPALTLEQMQAQGLVSYIAFPEALKGKYQSYTEADISALRGAVYDAAFYSVEEGTSRYIEHLLKT